MPDLPVQIRPMAAQEREVVLELVSQGLREQERHAAQCVPPEDAGFFESEVREHDDALAQGVDGWWVAVDRPGSVVGALWLVWAGDSLGPYASVRQVVVRPESRGHGIATRLIARAEEEAVTGGAVMFLISTLRPNPAARLYRRLGFTELPSQHRKDPNPEHVVLWRWYGEKAPVVGRSSRDQA